jgi:hypothetical protein
MKVSEVRRELGRIVAGVLQLEAVLRPNGAQVK